MHRALIHEWFSSVASTFAADVAVEFGDRRLSFAELEQWASAIGRKLVTNGICSGDVVALFIHDRIAMIACMIGVIKAGGAFVTLDLSSPPSRIDAMMEIAQPRFTLVDAEALSQSSLPESLQKSRQIVLEWDSEVADHPDFIPPAWDPDGLCYIFFTSGSTGQPKGIAGRLRAIDHFVRWELEKFANPSRPRVSQLISPGFDAFLRDVFVPLCSGGTICIPPDEVRAMPGELVKWLRSERINLIHTVPSVFRAVTESLSTPGYLKELKTVLLAGEPLFPSDVEKWFQMMGEEAKLVNLYGPSETTMTKFFHVVEKADRERTSVPIGKPMEGARALLLDENLKPSPNGTVGEIYIRTPYRSLGYYGNPELTSQVFIPNPFSNDPKDLIYRTGDFARALPNGDVEFVGRRDGQVKIRGVRVELGEVESYLRSSDLVKDCAVVECHEPTGPNYLCAYVVLKQNTNRDLIRTWLFSRLPEAAVPSIIVELQDLPRLPNGKIDKKALPDPHVQNDTQGRARTPTESALCSIWAEVLKLDHVGIFDNFFYIGGHSLRAAQVVSRIRVHFGIDFPLRYIFEEPTVSRLAPRVDESLKGNHRSAQPLLVRIDRSGPIPLSFAQRRLWFIDQLEGGSAAYNIPVAVRITGPLDTDALVWSLRQIVQRHELLRASVHAINGEPFQVINDSLDFPIAIKDLRHLTAPESEHAIEAECSHERRFQFDLNKAPLIRATILQIKEQVSVLLVTIHHLISDAWSAGILIQEFGTLYSARSQSRPVELRPQSLQYADFAAWQRKCLQPDVVSRQMEFWKQKLEGIEPLHFPTDHPRTSAALRTGDSLPFHCPAEVTSALSQLAQREQVTLFTVLAGAFMTILACYSGQRDVAIGTDVAGRNHPELEGMIGFFINQLVLRTDLRGDATFRQVMAELQQYLMEAYSNQDLPFEQLVEELRPERDLSRSPFFQVKLVLQNQPAEAASFSGLRLEELTRSYGFARFDFTLALQEGPFGLSGIIEYSTDLFERATIQRFLERFNRLLQKVGADPEIRISALSLIEDQERRQLVEEWGRGVMDEQPAFSIVELFAAATREYPDNVALAFGEYRQTYAGLNQNSNRIAHYLRSLGVRTDTRVAVCCQAGPFLFEAILGILKSGGAYVPLDPQLPKSRLEHVLADAMVAVIITEAELVDLFPMGYAHTVCLDTDNVHIATMPSDDLCLTVHPEQLAYVIYTSGSTGKPKGVMVTHRGAINLARSQSATFDVQPHHSVLQFSSIGFDASFWEWMMALMSGARLVLAARDFLIPGPEMADFIRNEKIDFVTLPPSVGAALPPPDDTFPRTMILAGEECSQELVKKWSAGRRLFNAYGPTEVTVCATISAPLNAGERPVIGRPILNTSAFILNSDLDIVPAGMEGDLYIGGSGLARGYANMPVQTALAFLPDCFSPEPGSRLYRTGDRAVWRPDGKLDFLGRKDSQVKIRGHRIELGEVEAVISALPGVKQCTVSVRADEGSEDRHIVAYWIADAGLNTDNDSLRAELMRVLPPYMVPAFFMKLDAIPLNLNGKVDRKALPRPQTSDVKSTEGFTSTEEIILGLWRQIGVIPASIHDSFFEAGGHSLLATQLISRVQETFEIELPLRSIFEASTIKDFALRVEDALRRGERRSIPPIIHVSKDKPLPLSFAQTRMWFLDQLDPGNALYNISTAIRFKTELNTKIFRSTLAELVRRHESLRTIFPVIDGEPAQVIGAPMIPKVPHVDVSEMESAAERACLEVVQAESALPFDLCRGPLLRVVLVQLAAADFVISFTMHHIIGDGWSGGILAREFSCIYEAFSRCAPSPLPEPAIQYGDYTLWQRSWLQGEVLEATANYWADVLDGVTVLDLPTDKPRPAVASHKGAVIPVRFSPELTTQLKSISHQHGVTLFMTLLAGYQILLGRYACQDDVAIGTDIANRNHPGTENLVGFLINQLVLRTNLSGQPSFAEVLRRVRESALGAYVHQDLPFEQLVEMLRPERDLSHTPLFQAKLVLQNLRRESLNVRQAEAEGFPMQHRLSKFDFTLILEDNGHHLEGILEYATDLFEPETVRQFVEHLEHLFRRVCEDPQKPVEQLPLLENEEIAVLLHEWNGAQQNFQPEICLHQLVEAQARAHPQKVAIVCGAERLTYAELDLRAEMLSRSLRVRGVKPECRVGLFLERSIEMAIAILAVAKSGGAYVPLEPNSPKERLRYILENANITLLLHGQGMDKGLPNWKGVRLSVGEEEELDAPCTAPLPQNAAYVIYTSGSTGFPKGVVVTHANVSRLLAATQEAFQFSSNDVWTMFHSVAFDFSVWEYWGCLAFGGRLVIVPYWISRSAEDFHELLVQESVTVLNQTPSAFKELDRVDAFRSTPVSSLRLVIFGGEALQLSSLRDWIQRHGARPRLVNMYGITETTVHVTRKELDGDEIEHVTRSRIGCAISDLSIYVLDGNLMPVPTGIAGELYVGGPGLARGYINQGGLTALRFVPDLFSGEPGSRLYKTGDIVRWIRTGELEYLGRGDSQVKIRGHRIELGEIEAILHKQPGIELAAVVLNQAEYLVGYVTGAGASDWVAGPWRQSLAEHLPEYMLPLAIIVLDEMPLTENGKLDVKALPDVERDQTRVRIMPQSAIQEILAGFWRQILQLEEIGIDENFFELGGHSLLATQLVSRIREALKLEFPLRKLFEHPTVRGLATELEKVQSVERPPIQRSDRAGELPLSYAQQRMWFLDRLNPGSGAYNVPFVFRLAGVIDEDAMQKTIDEIVRRHEILRTTFPDRYGTPYQQIASSGSLPLLVIDLSDVPDPVTAAQVMINAQARVPFDLQNGPLLRAMVLRLGEDDRFLMFNMHHIVCDGWSKSVMVREFVAIYGAFKDGRPTPLPELEIQYADFAKWQRDWLSGDVLEQHMNYWRNQLKDIQVLELPTDFPRPAVAGQRGALIQFEWSPKLSNAIVSLCHREGVTLFMGLMAAFQVVLGRHASQNDVAIGTVIANRNRPEIENLIGFFVNSLVLRTRIHWQSSFRQLLADVRDTALKAYEHQDLTFDSIVEELSPGRDLSRAPLYQALFAVQNTPRESFDVSGVRVVMANTQHYQSLVDLAMVMGDTPGKLGGGLEYATDLYEPTSMHRLVDHFRMMLEMAVENPDRPLGDMVLLSAEERQQLVSWNSTEREWTGATNIVERFTAQARRTPDAVAVVQNEQRLTYAELEARANQLAHHLRVMGAGPEVRVALCVSRSPEMIVGLLGILKAGASYVPIDVSYPPDRISYMLEDAVTALVITEKCWSETLPVQWAQIVCIDSDWQEISAQPVEPPDVAIAPESLAYMIYTSGSSGQPKGVMLTHGGLHNLALSIIEAFGVQQGTVVLQFASLSFDVATWEWAMTLLAGGKLVLVPPDVQMVGDSMIDLVRREKIEVWSLPASVLAAMPTADLPALRTLCVGGETFSTDLLERWSEGRSFFNAYGPTETTVGATISSALSKGDLPFIGRAMSNIQVHVLDAAGRWGGPGVIGELYIGGVGVGRGYFNKPAATADKFVPDPFSREPGARLYRTGDRVRWRNEGQLDFISRIDNQVKIRGFRIEPGEIEAVLETHPGVQQAMVSVRQDHAGGRSLVAYVVPKQSSPRPAPGSFTLPNGMSIAQKNRYETEILYDEIFVRESYLRNGIKLPADGCVFDVGANIGMFTIFASLKCDKGKVFSFEPIPPIYEDLQANLKWCAGEVKIFPIALSDRRGTAQFTYFPKNAAMSARTDYVSPVEETEVIRQSLINQSESGMDHAGELLKHVDSLLAGRFEGEVVNCEMRRLSDVMKEEKIDHIDLLKIDVERSELDVLKGIDAADWPKIDQIVLEVHNRVANQSETRAAEIRELLTQNGLEVTVDEDDLLKGANIFMLYARRSSARKAQSAPIQSPAVIPSAVTGIDIDQVRKFLQEKLPAHMVPSGIAAVRTLPRLPNGKLDRSRLPEMELSESGTQEIIGPRDGNETVIINVWGEVLGRDDIGIRDDFFQIGGGSLNAVAVCAKLSSLFQSEIPVRTIFDHPTVETMASHIRQGVSAATPSTVVPVRASGTRTPIFCVHPGSGLPHCYLALARNLGADQPVYAIQSVGFKEDEDPLNDVESMAARYIQDMRAVCQNGPYQIIGWSMGVAPALEMAVQLTRMGANVSFLGMIDGGFAGQPVEVSPDEWAGEVAVAEREVLLAQAGMYLPDVLQQLSAMAQDVAVTEYLERAKEIDQIPRDVSAEQFRRVLRVMAINKLAQTIYVPKKYEGTITLIRTQVPAGMDPCYGLEKLADAGVQVFEIKNSHHLSFINEPELARTLLRCTEAASMASSVGGK